MNERERLIELIIKSDILCDTCGENSPSYCAEALADYLLANGATLLLADEEAIIRKVAYLKYGERKTSVEIGEELHYSTRQISRFLKKAKEIMRKDCGE